MASHTITARGFFPYAEQADQSFEVSLYEHGNSLLLEVAVEGDRTFVIDLSSQADLWADGNQNAAGRWSQVIEDLRRERLQ